MNINDDWTIEEKLIEVASQAARHGITVEEVRLSDKLWHELDKALGSKAQYVSRPDEAIGIRLHGVYNYIWVWRENKE
jgi:hypothetical protein